MNADVDTLASALDDTYLNLILFPTEKCNFRCTYCYEDFKHGRRSAETVSGIKALLTARSPDLGTLHLSWFGGEPLMAQNVVLDLSSHAQGLADQRGFSYAANMTTNGYPLTLALWRDLASVGVRDYQISLDGSPRVHDLTRRRADGAGTFARIWQNLVALHHSDLEVGVSLRVHYAPAQRRRHRDAVGADGRGARRGPPLHGRPARHRAPRRSRRRHLAGVLPPTHEQWPFGTS